MARQRMTKAAERQTSAVDVPGGLGYVPSMPRFHVVTLFPEFFDSPLDAALLGRARASGLVSCDFLNPRDFSTDRHRHTDDRPYGGGPGMVMLGEPLAAALRAIPSPGRMLVMAPSGRPMTQAMARQWAEEDDITLICGRYEGLDHRLNGMFPLEPVSLGDVVLNGGETAALAVIEAVSRLVPGFMGREESGEEESFSAGLLEYPHYTRPEILEGRAVPEILLGGDHARIARWRRDESLALTLERRPDLLDAAPLTREDAATLAELPQERLGRCLHLCLIHHPVMLEAGRCGTSSLTSLDVHDMARLSCGYALGGFHVVTPLEEQLRLLRGIIRHWTDGPGGAGNPDRARALRLVRAAPSLDAAVADVMEITGARPRLVATSAAWPEDRHAPPPMTCADVRAWCGDGPVLLCLGTARGLAPEVMARCDGRLRPIRFGGDNHLSVRSAAAVLVDRILGDHR